MRYQDLARMLEAHGYALARCTGSHRIWRDATGKVLTIAGKDGRKQYTRAELAPIRREIQRHQSAQPP